jgi:hypothetical protein
MRDGGRCPSPSGVSSTGSMCSSGSSSSPTSACPSSSCRNHLGFLKANQKGVCKGSNNLKDRGVTYCYPFGLPTFSLDRSAIKLYVNNRENRNVSESLINLLSFFSIEPSGPAVFLPSPALNVNNSVFL